MVSRWRKISRLDTYIDDFFSRHREALENSYPGISPSVIKRQLSHSLLVPDVDAKEWLSQAYFWRAESPLTLFFEDLLKGKPLAHLLEYSSFYRADFYITSDVLIPRSETEILVERASTYLARKFKAKSFVPRVLDVGSGSGAILLSMAQDVGFPMLGTGVDLSEKALKVAKINHFRLRYQFPKETELCWLYSDRLQAVEGLFDLIVSNPPYIKKREDRQGVHHQVDRFEPEMALYLNDEDYEQWFSTLFSQVLTHLAPRSPFIMEGHEDHLEELKVLAEKSGFDKVSLIKDYSGRWRFLEAFAP